MKVILAPLRNQSPIVQPSVFLAGSIDMGQAEHWQKKVEFEMQFFPITILNPRRDDWDSSWKQKDTDPQFRQQVEWELDMMDAASEILMFISSESKAPISLLEFGRITTKYPKKLTIGVGDDFYRRGNIEVMCRREGITLHNTIDAAISSLKIKLASQL